MNMDENTIRDEVANDLRKMFAEDKPYTDSERLAAYENLLAEIRNILLTPYEQMSDFPQFVIDRIDEEMDK